MLRVLTWLWKARPGYRSTFTAAHVNTLARMVDRHYPSPHEHVCVTDDPTGLEPHIRAIPLWSDHVNVPSPHGPLQPSCYRRLKAFSIEAKEFIGERFVSIDLDTVITGDLRPVWDRPEEFVIWGETDRRSWYNGSMWLMTAGARRKVWDEFDPKRSPQLAHKAGRFGSDQGWISYILGPGEATWKRNEGVYSWRVHLKPFGGRLPYGAKLVMFHGHDDPWGYNAQRMPWVREHYR